MVPPAPTTREPQTAHFAVIVGCDRVGSHLAARLDDEGCAVRLIDRDAASFSILPDRISAACFEGDPLELSVLRRAGLEEADILFAASCEDDLNAAVALVAIRLFGTDHVFARIDDPDRAVSYGRLGIETVCAMPAIAAAFLERIRSVARG